MKICGLDKNANRLNQDFGTKKDHEMMQRINEISANISLERIRKWISNSILLCHLHLGGVADDGAMDEVKEVKQQKKRHRGAAPMLMQ